MTNADLAGLLRGMAAAVHFDLGKSEPGFQGSQGAEGFQGRAGSGGVAGVFVPPHYTLTSTMDIGRVLNEAADALTKR